MNRKAWRALLLATVAIGTLVLSAEVAAAGPPLICHPMDIGDAQSLPWNGVEWRSVKADYDLSRLSGETVALLQPETPVIVHMETLRRAVVYSIWAIRDHKMGYTVNSPEAANNLLALLMKREHDARGKGPEEALARFDAGYFVEAGKQATAGMENGAPDCLRDIDGYALVRDAIRLRGSDPEMEFAAALISMSPPRQDYAEHLRKARAGAAGDSLLARNLASHFGNAGASTTGSAVIRPAARSAVLGTGVPVMVGACLIGTGLALGKRWLI